MIVRIRRIIYLWRLMGTRNFLYVSFSKLRSRIQKQDGTDSSTHLYFADSVHNIVGKKFRSLNPLRTCSSVEKVKTRKINVITDSIGNGSLFGGVGTALIFAAILANGLEAQLRIVTRVEPAQPSRLNSILALYGIKLKKDVQFKFAPFWDRTYEIDIAECDLFITTSWWTTAATLSSVPHASIIYLLQEDERMFYAFGDERLKCEAVLRNNDIKFLLNTKLLYDYFIKDEFNNIGSHGSWFEPAFPKHVFYRKAADAGKKFKLFFYARPNNPRNLFYLGLQVIERAIAQNTLNLDFWEIFLVGTQIPAVTFHGGYKPIKHENLSWSAYADFIGTVDLGLSLMYTPHPSYPPLDLAASGAVVVTNKYADKRDLSNYSPNIICAELDLDALVTALGCGVKLATNEGQRDSNYRKNNIPTDWHEVFAGSVQKFSGRL